MCAQRGVAVTESSGGAPTGGGYRSPLRALATATAGLVVGATLALILAGVATGWPASPAVLILISSYLVVWLPLSGASVVASRVAGRVAGSGLRHDTALAFRPVDVALGAAAGLVLRALAEILEPTTGSYGWLLLDPAAAGDRAQYYAIAAIMVLAAVVIGPVIEEVFFRGLLLRSLLGALAGGGGPSARGGRHSVGVASGRAGGGGHQLAEVSERAVGSAGAAGSRLVMVAAVIISSALFAGLHLLSLGQSPSWILLVVTFLLGVIAAALTLWTGRLGPAIVAHVTYNAIGLALAML